MVVVVVKVLSVCDVVERERECVLRQLECHITGSGWSILVLTVTSGASVARENTKHNNSQGLLGPAGTCCLLSSHDLPCCPGRRGGREGWVSSQDIEWRRGRRGDVASQSPQHYLDTGRT